MPRSRGCAPPSNLPAALALILSLVLAGCDKLPFIGKSDESQPLEEETAPRATAQVTDPGVLALVNGVPITMEIFRQRIEGLPEEAKPKTLDARRRLVDELIKEELLVQEAISLGLERDPTVKRQLESARRLVLLNGLAERDTGQSDVKEQDIRDFYSQLETEIGKRNIERLHVRQIVTATLVEAEQVRAQATQGGDFTQLARERSVGPGREQGGDVGWYLRQMDLQALATIDHVKDEKFFFPELEPVAFALEIGQISQPVKGPDTRYFLVKIESREKVRLKPITEMWSRIEAALAADKRGRLFQDRLDRLSAKARIERSEQRLEQL